MPAASDASAKRSGSDAVARPAVPDAEAPAGALEEDVVVGVLGVELEQVVVHVLRGQSGLHPLDPHGLELEHRQRPGRVLGEGLVDAQRDLPARLGLVFDEMRLHQLLGDVARHQPDRGAGSVPAARVKVLQRAGGLRKAVRRSPLRVPGAGTTFALEPAWRQRPREGGVSMARIAMPVAAGFEDSECAVPYQRLHDAGHEVIVLGARRGEVVEGKRGRTQASVQATPAELDVDRIDALVIPGGHSPDRLRTQPDVVDWVRRFFDTGKPIAAICHGPQLLIDAEVVDSRALTSWPSIRKDLENAGARWIDQDLVEDTNLITSRKPEDLEVFCKAILDRLARQEEGGQT
jgi:protease I